MAKHKTKHKSRGNKEASSKKAKEPKPKPLDGEFEAYCVKDGEKVIMDNPMQVRFKNGSYAAQGTCPDCGNKIQRIIGKEPIV